MQVEWRRVFVVLCDRRIAVREEGRFTKTVVKPAILYGLKTAALTKRQDTELEVAHLMMLRFSLGVTSVERIKNKHTGGITSIRCLGDKV